MVEGRKLIGRIKISDSVLILKDVNWNELFLVEDSHGLLSGTYCGTLSVE